MFVRTKTSPNSPRKTVQIVESKRIGKKISQRIVQHIGVAANDKELAELVKIAEQFIAEFEAKLVIQCPKKSLFPEMEEFSHENSSHTDAATACAPFEVNLPEGSPLRAVNLENKETVIDGPMEVVERMWSHMGLSRVFGDVSRDAGRRTTLKQTLAAMLCAPSSGIARWLNAECGSQVQLNSIYRLVDAISERETLVKKVVREQSEGLFAEAPSLLLFDVTTLYFESFEEDELRQCGYNKDDKFKETQLVLALATTPRGLPLWYEVFPGKTSEGATLNSFVNAWRNAEYPGSAGVVVSDRAMGIAGNIESLKERGLDYVIGAKLKSMPAPIKSEILALDNYRTLPDGPKYKVLRQDDSNILVTWDAKRSKKDKADREKLVIRAIKKLNAVGNASAKKLTGNRGTMRYLKETNNSSYVLDEEKILEEARWDGLQVVKTSLPLGSEEEVRSALSHYAWRIEESFRIKKHDLKIRPIYHWTEKRIRGHIALNYLAFACMRNLELRVELQQKERMSAEKLRHTMLGITSTIMKDRTTGKVYRFPKCQSEAAKKLYRSLGMVHSTAVKEVTSLERYRNRIRYLDSKQ